MITEMMYGVLYCLLASTLTTYTATAAISPSVVGTRGAWAGRCGNLKFYPFFDNELPGTVLYCTVQYTVPYGTVPGTVFYQVRTGTFRYSCRTSGTSYGTVESRRPRKQGSVVRQVFRSYSYSTTTSESMTNEIGIRWTTGTSTYVPVGDLLETV
jgi:hypothetical protein